MKPAPAPAYDTIDADPTPVIICGFGRFGQIIGRVLRMHGIEFTALERDPGQVEVVRRFGTKVYFGDPTRPDVLRAAGAEQAKLLVVALDDPPGVLRTVEVVKRNFPNLAILARARNRWYAHLLMDRDVDGLVRETFHSSLQLAKQALTVLGIDEAAAERAVTLFREHDEKTLLETHAIYRDEQQLIQSQQQAADELASLFEADRRVTGAFIPAASPASPATTRVSPTPRSAASTANAIRTPRVSAIQPPNVVLIPAPRLTASPSAPMQRLKCDVPRVMSAAISGSITPNTAALMPLTALRGNRQIGTRQHRQQQAPQRQCGPAQQQHGTATERRRAAAHRGRAQRHDPLRHHDARRDDQVGEVARTHRDGGSDQRQHRGIGHVEQQHTDRECEQASIAEQSSQPRPVEWRGSWSVVSHAGRGRLPAGPAAQVRTVRPSV